MRVLVACVWLLTGCVLQDLELAGRPCPCADGYVCDTSEPAPGVCVVSLASGLGDGDSGDGDAPGGGGSGGGDTGGGDGDAAGGGDGDAVPVGDGDLPAGDGDAAPGIPTLADGGVAGDVKTCPAVEPPPADCPAECTHCNGGVCTFVCDLPASCMLPITCPPGWPCVVDCTALTGPGACNAGRLICGDAPCELRCNSSTCSGYTLQCGNGPCRAVGCNNLTTVTCGGSCLCTGTCE